MKKSAIFIAAATLFTSAWADNSTDQSTTTTTAPTTTMSAPKMSDVMPSTQPGSGFNDAQVQQIQKIVHDYLISNPEVLVKASEALQQKQAAQSQKDAMSAIKENVQALFSDSQSPTAGNQNGNLEVVEFFDYQCGYCKAMASIIESVLKTNNNVRVIFKELPIFGGNSHLAAQAALASTKQNKYFEFHNALFAAEKPLNEQSIFAIAKSVGLDVKKLKAEMKKPWIDQQIKANFGLAEKLKLMGTPAFVMSNKANTDFRFIPRATSKDEFNNQLDEISQQ